jgi:Family of unknown function (DUF5670)
MDTAERSRGHARLRLTSDHGTGVALPNGRTVTVLDAVAVTLLVAWLLGVVGSYAIGGAVHLLLVLALVLLLVGALSEQPTLV